MRILLVGGAVRDILLGRSVRDRDYLVLDASVEEFLAAHPTARAVGKSFPVVILNEQEYTFPRAESLDADLALRDLTINALALDESGTLTAHPQALDDITNRVLRPASPRSLADDPVRAFRAARFWAELPDFAPHPELITAMRGLAGTPALASVFAERVGHEALKACSAPKPGNFLRLLRQGGCLVPWLAEFAKAADIPCGPPPRRNESVLAHTADLMDALAGEPLRVWMALCHDIGKVTTPSEKLPHHVGHEKRGETLAAALGNRLRLPQRYVRAGADAARWHLLAGKYAELRPGPRVDLLFHLKAGAVLNEMFRLAAADSGADSLSEAQEDLRAALAVSLPPSERDRGAASGELLRLLRAQAIDRRIGSAT